MNANMAFSHGSGDWGGGGGRGGGTEIKLIASTGFKLRDAVQMYADKLPR